VDPRFDDLFRNGPVSIIYMRHQLVRLDDRSAGTGDTARGGIAVP
jgi:hypothetical protein